MMLEEQGQGVPVEETEFQITSNCLVFVIL